MELTLKSQLRRCLQEGDCCAQAMVRMGLLLRGEENEQLVCVAGALCNGIHSGLLCGALSGAACLLTLYNESLAKNTMIPDLKEWFEDRYAAYNCEHLLKGASVGKHAFCTQLIEDTFMEAMGILNRHGFFDK